MSYALPAPRQEPWGSSVSIDEQTPLRIRSTDQAVDSRSDVLDQNALTPTSTPSQATVLRDRIVLPAALEVSPTSALHTIQCWEGVVTSSPPYDRQFAAHLVDRTDPSRPEEEATFDVAEVSESDVDLLAEGAVFYWMIGHEDSLAGQRRNLSQLVFRRLPRWHQSEAKQIEREVEKLARAFGVRE